MVFGFHIEPIKRFLVRYRRFWLAIALICVPLGVAEWEIYFRLSGAAWLPTRETLLDSLFTLAVLASFLAYQDVSLPFSRQLEKLGQQSYGIYLTHAIFIEYTAKIIYHLAPGILAYQVILLPILIIVGLGIPILMMATVDRSPYRRYYKYLFG
jgi:peptidoglycan/LPS O-acetylase OafA/YrhL